MSEQNEKGCDGNCEGCKCEEQREMTLAEVEKSYILHILDGNKGNKTLAAQTLVVTVKTLYNKLHEYGMMPKKDNIVS